MILKDTPTQAAQKKLEQSPARSLVVGSPVGSTQIDQPVDTGEQFKTESVKFKVSDKIAATLHALTGVDLSNLMLDDALDEANLKLNVVLTYDRKTSKCGQRVLDTVATSMRHMDSSDFTINLANGVQIRGDELRISSPIKVETINGSVNRTGLIAALHTWMRQNTPTE